MRAIPLLLASLTASSLGACRDWLPTDPPCLPSFALDAAGSERELVVHVLDVGQGDANVIINGGRVVIIDGGRTGSRFGELLDSLELNNSSVLAVILSHGHSDHASGLKEIFRQSRNIKVDYYFDNTDVSTNASVQTVRDSAKARASRGELVYRDTDDPCGDGSPICTLTFDGGARLHVMRPMPDAADPDDRSTPVKLVGPDSASFSMWFAGDARYGASEWFERGAAYHLHPGMKVRVLKGLEHGHRRSTPPRLLQLTTPEWVTFSLGADNDKKLVHTETKELLASRGIGWYRTDQNGTITFVSPGTPGGGYSVSVHGGTLSMSGPQDGSGCREI